MKNCGIIQYNNTIYFWSFWQHSTLFHTKLSFYWFTLDDLALILSLIFRLTILSNALMKFHQLVMMKFLWKPTPREAHHQFSLALDPCLQTGRLIRNTLRFILPFPAVRGNNWRQMSSSGNISTPSLRRTCQLILLLLHRPLPATPESQAAAAGWGEELSLEVASPSVSRAPVSQSQTSPPSLTV